MSQNNRIQVLGSGCPSCKRFFLLVQEVTTEMQLGISVEYITDIQQIISIGVLQSPVLVVNGKVVMAGLIPDKQKIKQLLQQNMAV